MRKIWGVYVVNKQLFFRSEGYREGIGLLYASLVATMVLWVLFLVVLGVAERGAILTAILLYSGLGMVGLHVVVVIGLMLQLRSFNRKRYNQIRIEK